MSTKDRSKAAFPTPPEWEPGPDAPAGRPVPPLDLARVASLREQLVRLQRELVGAQAGIKAAQDRRSAIERQGEAVKAQLLELLFGRPGELI